MRITNLRSWIFNGNRGAVILVTALFLAPLASLAFPPAPHHTIFGILRDQWGNPMPTANATITFITEGGITLTAPVSPGLQPGVNYRLTIPMDSGTAPDLYRPTAQRPFVPFRIKVKVGNTTYLPMEMTGDFRQLGQPAGFTRIDLTLGADSDGDGLPDAWKDMVIAMMGGGLTRADITPDGDIDGDGMTNMEEYIAGTYAWDSEDRLWLDVIEVAEEHAVLEFLAIDGRTYTIHGSTNLRDWAPVPFRVKNVDAAGTTRAHYHATQVRRVQAVVELDPEKPRQGLYSLEVR